MTLTAASGCYLWTLTSVEDIKRRFWPHEMTEAQLKDSKSLRTSFEVLADEILGCTPGSREQSLALTQLEQASFWAIAAIARRES